MHCGVPTWAWEFPELHLLKNDVAPSPEAGGGRGCGVVCGKWCPVWPRVGAEVTILEAAPTFLAAADQQIAKEAFKYFTKEQGLNIELGVKIGDIKSEGKGVSVAYETAAGEAKTEVFDKLIVAIGRIPNTKGLNAEAVGLEKDERGFIKVDGECRTNLPNVWAIGDVVRGPMLAHKASDEGVAVAERIAGQKPHIDFNNVPFVIYTDPEIAWVGKTEEQLKAEGVEYKKGTSGFGANGRALAMGKAKGTVKVLADAKTDRILGVHMIGPVVSELVTEGVTALEFFASSEDIARIIHAHPTLSEVVHEAALAADKRALHSPRCHLRPAPCANENKAAAAKHFKHFVAHQAAKHKFCALLPEVQHALHAVGKPFQRRPPPRHIQHKRAQCKLNGKRHAHCALVDFAAMLGHHDGNRNQHRHAQQAM